MRGTVSALCAGILCAVLAACADRAETLLHETARIGDFSEVKALIKAGVDPKARAEHGLTPLHYAALGNGNPSVVKALLDAGGTRKPAPNTAEFPSIMRTITRRCREPTPTGG